MYDLQSKLHMMQMEPLGLCTEVLHLDVAYQLHQAHLNRSSSRPSLRWSRSAASSLNRR